MNLHSKFLTRIVFWGVAFIGVLVNDSLQAQICGPTTPTFTVNLTGQPNGTYMSPPVVRDDTCCGATAPDRCVQFIVTLDPAAVGLIFTVCNGAVPPGALYYQVNCGPPQPVGTGICLNPPYPDTITFCKPGNNQNQYCIQSIAPPSVVGLSQNCSALMWTFGFEDSTIVWNSVFPGPFGAYNSYLSCQSGCDSTWVTPQTGYPPYIDFQVCGTVTNGCNKSFCDTVRVVFPAPLTVAPTFTNVACYGGNTGAASANMGGGIPPYSYSWSPAGGTGATAGGLTAGNYTCIITDSAGCTITTSVVITQPPILTATFTTNPATCSLANGDATVIPAGGTPPYTYQWLNGQTTATATGLGPGVYIVTIGDANGCPLTLNIPVSNVLPIVTVNTTSVTCFGTANGSATSNASGGIPPYTYLWSNGQTTSTATGLAAGNYTIATSSSGCTNYNIATILGPTALTGTLVAQSNVSCNGGNNGSASFNFSGGTPGYSYQWSNGSTTAVATGLAAGNHTLTVTDAQNCISNFTVNITQPPALASASPAITHVACFGANTGSAAVNVTGGTPAYTYAWSPSGGNSSAASGLGAGNYTCVTTDQNGCIVTNTVSITQPAALTSTITGNFDICSGYNSSLNASMQGGVPGYTFSWNPSGNSTSSIVVSPSASTIYTLTITDANGCVLTDTQLVNIFPQPVAAFNAPNACLNNPTLFSDQSGGGGGNSWWWNFGEPASGPNNVSSLQNPSHTYGAAGTYTVSFTVINANGCKDSVSQVVIINPLPSVSFASSTVCQGNTTTFLNTSSIVSGSISSWSWNFGDPASGPNNISSAQSPTHIFTAAGTFNVILTATSDSGCQGNITIPVIVLPLPTASFVPTSACTNTPVYFTDASSLATQWNWDFGNLSATSNLQHPNYTYPSIGIYVVTLTVTTSGGCVDTTSQVISVAASPVPNFSPDTVCVSFPTSFTDLTVAPGGNVVDWIWNFGDGSAQDTAQNPVHTYALPGTYTVSLTATSSNGCVSTGIKTVIVYPQPAAAFSYTPESCIDLGEMVEFQDLSSGSLANWYWYFGDSSAVNFNQNPNHVFNDTGHYVVTLIVQDVHGCLDTTVRELCIREWSFFIPNAFTPNGHGPNEFFSGFGIGILETEMWIFDRWGNMFFHCFVKGVPQSLPCQWNGRVRNDLSNEIVQEDVYVWKIRIINVLDVEHKYIGTVTVVR